MHLKFRNCNQAFHELVFGIKTGTIRTRRSPSRVGDVLQIEEPVIITYSHPNERVLFNKARDANPFFHLYEALWMLAGRNDVAPLAYYNSQIEDIASDNHVTFNGAYGYRWRNSDADDGQNRVHVDQLKIIIDHLKRKPESRRVVLQMWTVEDDLLRIDRSKDVCCNVCAFFSIREERWPEPRHLPIPCDAFLCLPEQHPSHYGIGVRCLDMTVINRSNDLIWGSLGANVVHFSVLQEYLAAAIGVEVGVYNQISNNLHVYTDRWEPEKWLAEGEWKYGNGMKHFPLVRDPACFDREVKDFVDCSYGERFCIGNWDEPFLQYVASPMMWAFFNHKRRDYKSALQSIDLVQAQDWQSAGRSWIAKRKHQWETKYDARTGVAQADC